MRQRREADGLGSRSVEELKILVEQALVALELDVDFAVVGPVKEMAWVGL